MNIRKTKRARITYAKKDVLGAKDFRSEAIGHRISIVIPENILMAFRRMAEETGIGYQTLMNQVLRKAVIQPAKVGSNSFEARLSKLEKTIFQSKKKAA